MNGKRLYKSRDNRMISGVCAGIAEYFGIDPHAGPSGLGGVQPAGGSGLLAYIIAAIIVPENPAD